jgi:hypothetical protein
MSSVKQDYSGGQNNPDPLPQSNIQSVEYTDVYHINYSIGDTCSVASVSALGPLQQIYSVSTKNIYYKLGAAYNARIGLLCYISTSSLIGLAPRSVSVTLSKTAAPTGTLYARMYDYQNAMIEELANVSVATITNLDLTYTFTDLTNVTIMRHKSKLVIEYIGGDAANYVNINISDTDAFDGQNTVIYRMTSDSNGSVESVNPVQDLAAAISI